MKQLDSVQNGLFLSGAVMMVVGVGCVVFGFAPKIMSIVFALGAIFFALMQMSQTYDGNSTAVRRLRSIMIIGDLCFILSALMMIENVYRIFMPFICSTLEGNMFYTQYINNNWVILLLVAAVIEIYTTHRLSYELKKNEGKEQ